MVVVGCWLVGWLLFDCLLSYLRARVCVYVCVRLLACLHLPPPPPLCVCVCVCVCVCARTLLPPTNTPLPPPPLHTHTLSLTHSLIHSLLYLHFCAYSVRINLNIIYYVSLWQRSSQTYRGIPTDFCYKVRSILIYVPFSPEGSRTEITIATCAVAARTVKRSEQGFGWLLA